MPQIKTASLYESLEFNPDRPTVKVWFETPFTKEIRIALKKGQELKEHKTSFPIVVNIVEGNINFGLSAERIQLRKGDLIALEGNVPHDLVAVEESIVRLTLSLHDTTDRVKNVAEQKTGIKK